jgi:glycosyltransferase involved in cell wall biosynthesis
VPRIVFVANSVSGGGAELVTRFIASRLNSVEFQSSFVAINDWPDDEEQLTCEVYRLRRTYKGSLLNLVTSLFRFSVLVRKRKPDFLVLNCELPELFSIFAPRRAKRIVVEHASKPWSRIKLLGIIVRRFLVLSDATWVSVSPVKNIWGVGSGKGIHIPNPHIHNLMQVSNEHKLIRRLFYVGRLTSIKQPHYLVEASRELGIPAILIGDGPEMVPIQEQVLLENLDITLLGHSLTPWNFLKEGDLVVVPSLYEGDGLVVSEALTVGAPILLLDTPDLRRFELNDSNYFHDFSDLLAKINKHRFDTSEITPSENTRRSHSVVREPEAVIKKWKALFLSLTKDP